MPVFFQNMGNIAVLVVLAAALAAAVWVLIKRKRSGKGCCGGCDSCPSGTLCHKQTKEN